MSVRPSLFSFFFLFIFGCFVYIVGSALVVLSPVILHSRSLWPFSVFIVLSWIPFFNLFVSSIRLLYGIAVVLRVT
ncbi:hypothetical protein BKA65DRAFT_498392 [Rhexocercosporidium sp. MPI-PUGE-AT-0058]|nr:hypothetical protein BKA65DRAFT_498392 [Rhexocercosporidium sp. MPI-PUGE-AT-0058]